MYSDLGHVTKQKKIYECIHIVGFFMYSTFDFSFDLKMINKNILFSNLFAMENKAYNSKIFI